MIGELNDGHVNLIQYGNDGAILRTKETKWYQIKYLISIQDVNENLEGLKAIESELPAEYNL